MDSDPGEKKICLPPLHPQQWWTGLISLPTWCHLLFYFTSYVLNMFRTLIYPSSGACDTTPTQPHLNSNTHRTKNNTTNVVIQQNSRKLLMMDILMSETCWAHKLWNKIASDNKLVFYSSTITMMHGPINIRLKIFTLNREDWLSVAEWFRLGLKGLVCTVDW